RLQLLVSKLRSNEFQASNGPRRHILVAFYWSLVEIAHAGLFKSKSKERFQERQKSMLSHCGPVLVMFSVDQREIFVVTRQFVQLKISISKCSGSAITGCY